jgi:hypothetical protein
VLETSTLQQLQREPLGIDHDGGGER